jgi:hypothetical protein
MWHASWSPDGKYLLVTRGGAHEGTFDGRYNGLSSVPPKPVYLPYLARLFRLPDGELLWQRNKPGINNHISWQMERNSVWLDANGAMRRFNIDSGADTTPRGSLAISKIASGALSTFGLKIFEESPTWLRLKATSATRGSAARFLEVGDLSGKSPNRYRLSDKSATNLNSLTLASERGRWILQVGPVTVGENAVSFVSFDGKLIRRWRGKISDDRGASFNPVASPDGRIVGHKRFRNLLRLWNVRTGEDRAVRFAGLTPDRLQDQPPLDAPGLTSNEDGSRWLIADPDLDLRLFDARFNRTRAAVNVRATHAVFSEDEKSVFWVDADTGKMGRLSLNQFSRRVRCEMVDAPTSRPQVLEP